MATWREYLMERGINIDEEMTERTLNEEKKGNENQKTEENKNTTESGAENANSAETGKENNDVTRAEIAELLKENNRLLALNADSGTTETIEESIDKLVNGLDKE